jgi:hypothetical protein
MKHYEVNFVDGTVETVGSDDLPPSITNPLYVVTKEGETESIVEKRWWTGTILASNPDSGKLIPHGRVHVNLDNVTFIKEA